MSARQELLDAEDARWHVLCDLLKRLDDDAMLRPGVNGEWTAKDLMAHVAAWHALTTDRFEALRARGVLPDPPDTDAFNADAYERCRAVSLHDARAMFESSRHRFREEIAALPEPLSERVMQIIAANGHDHYDEHIPQLETFLEGR